MMPESTIRRDITVIRERWNDGCEGLLRRLAIVSCQQARRQTLPSKPFFTP
jgi:hypothetical protein